MPVNLEAFALIREFQLKGLVDVERLDYDGLYRIYVRRNLERIDKYIVPDHKSGCLIWTGGTTLRDGQGYGRCLFIGMDYVAHRLIYQLKHGVIPRQLVLHHRCYTKLCVNPEHLELLTPSEHKKLDWTLERRRAVSQILSEAWRKSL